MSASGQKRTSRLAVPSVPRDAAWSVRDSVRNRSLGRSFTSPGGAPAMRFESSVVLVVFWFNAAAAQEGYLGHDHDKWHRSFYQMLLRPDSRTGKLTRCSPCYGASLTTPLTVSKAPAS